MTMNFEELVKFTKEFKALKKKYRSLPKDLSRFKDKLSKAPLPPKTTQSSSNRIIGGGSGSRIVKYRLACQSLGKGSSGSMRIIYAYLEEEQKIEFIQIYYRVDKQKSKRKYSQERIDHYFETRKAELERRKLK